jgi:hypothetical protein
MTHIKKSAEELKRTGVVEKYTYENNRQKDDGGILTFWPVVKEKVLIEKEVENIVPKIKFEEVLQLFPNDFINDTVCKIRLQEWFEYRPNLTMKSWKALAQEWSEHNPNEISSKINFTISAGYSSVQFKEKKELKCPYNKRIFGKDFKSSRVGCVECKIADECRQKYSEENND